MRPLNRTMSAASAPMAGDPPMKAESLPLRSINPRQQRGDDETADHRWRRCRKAASLRREQPAGKDAEGTSLRGPERNRERERRSRALVQRGAQGAAMVLDDP